MLKERISRVAENLALLTAGALTWAASTKIGTGPDFVYSRISLCS